MIAWHRPGQARFVFAVISLFSAIIVSPTLAQSGSVTSRDASVLDSVDRFITGERSRQHIPGLCVRLGSTVEHICYARGTGKERRVVVSVFYTADWRAALFEIEDY